MSEFQYCFDPFQSGARKCLHVLRDLLRERDSGELSLEQVLEGRDAAIAEIVATAGVASDQAIGAMTLLAEFVVDLHSGMSIDEVTRWRPETLMSQQEKDAERKECLGDNQKVLV